MPETPLGFLFSRSPRATWKGHVLHSRPPALVAVNWLFRYVLLVWSVLPTATRSHGSHASSAPPPAASPAAAAADAAAEDDDDEDTIVLRPPGQPTTSQNRTSGQPCFRG